MFYTLLYISWISFSPELESVYFLNIYMVLSIFEVEIQMKTFIKLMHFSKDRHTIEFCRKILSLQAAKLVTRLPGMEVLDLTRAAREHRR